MTVFVNAILYYKVADATHAVANVEDYSGSARLLAATTLRNVLGTLTLGDILSQRQTIANEMKVKDNKLELDFSSNLFKIFPSQKSFVLPKHWENGSSSKYFKFKLCYTFYHSVQFTCLHK